MKANVVVDTVLAKGRSCVFSTGMTASNERGLDGDKDLLLNTQETSSRHLCMLCLLSKPPGRSECD